jgi:O-antigen/teichoic acid export membrane protein
MDVRLYLKHYLSLLSGTVIAQLVNFASYPVLTRMYTPHDFGVFSIFLATQAIIGNVSCGRFDVVIQAASFSNRFSVYVLSQVINLLISIVSTILLLFYTASFNGVIDSTLAVMIGIAIFLTGYCNASSMFLLKHEGYNLNSISMVLRTLLTALPQIGLFYLLPNAYGLAGGFVAGFLCQAIFLTLSIRRTVGWRASSLRKLRFVIQLYHRYPLFDIPSTLLSSLSMQALNFFLLFLYSTEMAGFYAIAFRLAGVPAAIFSSTLAQVYFQKASKAFQATGTFWAEMKFNLQVTSALVMLIFVPSAFLAKPVIGLYLGKDWIMSAQIIIWLLPMISLRFISNSIATTGFVIGRPQWLLYNNIAVTLAVLVSFLIAYFWSLPLSTYLIVHSAILSGVSAIFILYNVWYSSLYCRYKPAG